MSANLNFNKTKGTVSFVSAIEPAWHKSGKILDHTFTSAEAIEHANLDYVVDLAPIYAKFSDDRSLSPEQRGCKIKDNFATYRRDTNEVFGIVGSKYEIVQNNEVFRFFDGIVEKGDAIYETAGVLGIGETIFITAKLPNNIILPGKDIIEKYILLTSSHDGTGATTALFTPTRVVCANTLAIAFQNGTNKFVVRHTKSAHDRITEGAKLMGLVTKSSEQLEIALDAMSRVRIKDEQLVDYIRQVFLTKEEIQQLINTGDHRKTDISTRKINVMDEVYKYSYRGIGQDTNSTKGTLFGAYSSISGYFNNTKEYKNNDAKMKSLVFEGTDFKVNQKAFDLACELTNKW